MERLLQKIKKEAPTIVLASLVILTLIDCYTNWVILVLIMDIILALIFVAILKIDHQDKAPAILVGADLFFVALWLANAVYTASRML